ncbi:MAG: hypothetical protein J7L66_01055 [Anaerolineaceae bacterium]|nr:hypothetical protein [Anaerolineaceae bacterium]
MAINIGKITIGSLWKSRSEVFKLIISHLHRYPLMEVQDVYALIYEGTMGADYLTAGTDDFEKQLVMEYSGIIPNRAQLLWEKVCPSGELVRVYMGALKARGGRVQTFSTLSLWTASIFMSDKENLTDGWETFQRICAENRLNQFSQEEISAFSAWLVENNYPDTGHTKTYCDAYDPHYRLMQREFLKILLEQD